MRKIALSGLFILATLAPSLAQQDLMTELVLKSKPDTPSAFIRLLEQAGHSVTTQMVANRGAHNPARGSFSIFGDVGPELTFGVFVEPDSAGRLVLQESFDTRLLVEVITVDQLSGLHNFWELIGEKERSVWYYRGNSLDVIEDAKSINMQARGEPLFGRRLRCSGCHTGGGLVMKERFPYNDWKTEASLPRASWMMSQQVEGFFQDSQGPERLDRLVESGLRSYVQALEKRSPESEKQWMRSVLAPLEMNLLSDSQLFEKRQAEGTAIEIPAAFFVDLRLSGEQAPVVVSIEVYQQALEELGSTFAPEETPGLLETQHAFLVPTVSKFDLLRTESLLKRGLLDEELLADLLAVDFSTPIYSPHRLKLMSVLPENWRTSEELRSQLLKRLDSERGSGPAGALLAQYLRDPKYGATYHRARAQELLARCRENASSLPHVKDWLRLAAQRRMEIQAAQTSANPRGAILEGGLGTEGFRRIFPSYSALSPKAHELWLDPQTGELDFQDPLSRP